MATCGLRLHGELGHDRTAQSEWSNKSKSVASVTWDQEGKEVLHLNAVSVEAYGCHQTHPQSKLLATAANATPPIARGDRGEQSTDQRVKESMTRLWLKKQGIREAEAM